MIEKFELVRCPLCNGAIKKSTRLNGKGLPKEVKEYLLLATYLPNYKCEECYSIIIPSHKGLYELSWGKFVTVREIK